jgi:molybdopterin-synthase adenylyltransferase
MRTYKNKNLPLFQILMDRYSRQLLYKNIGKTGQSKLLKSTVCIIGIGALGSVCSELLTRAGIGKLVLIDRDYIELNNLQRQMMFDESDIGKSKSITAKEKLSKINSGIKITAKIDDLDCTNVKQLIGTPDLILGCTDNMESRF